MNLSRRTFLGQVSALYTKRVLSLTGLDGLQISSPALPEIGSPDLQPNQFHLLPLTSIRPARWLLDQLRIQASGLWNKDFEEHTPRPTTTVPDIEYMLAGGTQRSDSDLLDKTSPPINFGPHWIILWAFGSQDLGTTYKT